MTFRVEVVLRDTDVAVTEMVQHAGNEPGAWTEVDVEAVLKSMLLAIDRARNPEVDGDRPIALRGLSWIVNPFDDGVVIALEIPSGAAVAGPFEIEQARLDGLVGRVIALSAGPSAGSSLVH